MKPNKNVPFYITACLIVLLLTACENSPSLPGTSIEIVTRPAPSSFYEDKLPNIRETEQLSPTEIPTKNFTPSDSHSAEQTTAQLTLPDDDNPAETPSLTQNRPEDMENVSSENSSKDNAHTSSENSSKNNEKNPSETDKNSVNKKPTMPYEATKGTYQGKMGMTTDDYRHWIVNAMSSEALKYIDEVLDEIIKKDMTKKEKVRAVHDWLVAHVNYDWTFENQTIDTALFKGLTVCNGYSDCMMIFLRELGIECVEVLGNSRGVFHMWNAVLMDDGLWYYVDVTWDDPTCTWETRNSTSTEIYTDYFLITREKLLKDHTFSEDYTHPSNDATQAIHAKRDLTT